MSVDTQRAVNARHREADRPPVDRGRLRRGLGYTGNEVAAETTVRELTEYGGKPLAMRAVAAEEADVVALRRRRDVRR